jgi:N-acetylneuraminic acid mutarotase
MKRVLQIASVFLFLLLTMSVNGYAQWSLAKSIYGGTLANDGAFAFSIGNKGYICAGSSTGDIYQYDTLTNAWTNKGTVPVSMGHAFAMGFVINNKAYVVGGDSAGYPMKTVYMYDPAATSNNWVKKNDFPGGVRDAGVGFAIGNTGYVGCGFDGTGVHNDLWKYNEATDSWTQVLNNLPVAELMFPGCFVINNKAYVVTGATAAGTGETSQMWQFDPVTENWTVKAPFPGIARQATFSFSNNSCGYVGGGMSGYMTEYYDMWRYNPVYNNWALVQSTPMLGPSWASAFVVGTVAYVGLGAKFAGTSLIGNDSFYRYRTALVTVGNNINDKAVVWNVYPNPAQDIVHLEGKITSIDKVVIYDSYGRIVKSLPGVPGNTIDVKELPSGVYTVQLHSSDNISSRLFVKE